MGAYIINIPDSVDRVIYINVNPMNGKTYTASYSVENLTPYTEPDIEQVRKYLHPIAADALSSAFDELNISSSDDLAHVDLNDLLREMIIAFINFSFDLHYHEKIGQGRTPAETKDILTDIHKYIANALHDKLTPAEIGKIDLSSLGDASLVSSMLHDAYSICMDYYGDSNI